MSKTGGVPYAKTVSVGPPSPDGSTIVVTKECPACGVHVTEVLDSDSKRVPDTVGYAEHYDAEHA